MSRVEFKVGGKTVSEDELSQSIYESLLNQVAERVKECTTTCICPEHNTSPEVVIVLSDDGEIGFEIETCCTEHKNRAKEALIISLGLTQSGEKSDT